MALWHTKAEGEEARRAFGRGVKGGAFANCETAKLKRLPGFSTRHLLFYSNKLPRSPLLRSLCGLRRPFRAGRDDSEYKYPLLAATHLGLIHAAHARTSHGTVSYTHLTLPTIE